MGAKKNKNRINIRQTEKGAWVEKVYDIDNEKFVAKVCSLCGENQSAGLGLARYCPSCGAIMTNGAWIEKGE